MHDSIIDTLASCNLSDLPVVCRFLFSSLGTASSERLETIMCSVRSQLSAVLEENIAQQRQQTEEKDSDFKNWAVSGARQPGHFAPSQEGASGGDWLTLLIGLCVYHALT